MAPAHHGPARTAPRLSSRAEVPALAKQQSRRTGTHLLGLLECGRPVRPFLLPELHAIADRAAVKAVMMPPVRILHRHVGTTWGKRPGGHTS